MIDDALMAQIMDAATADEPDSAEALRALWMNLSERDRMYAMGYVDGYVEGCRHAQMAMGYNEE